MTCCNSDNRQAVHVIDRGTIFDQNCWLAGRWRLHTVGGVVPAATCPATYSPTTSRRGTDAHIQSAAALMTQPAADTRRLVPSASSSYRIRPRGSSLRRRTRGGTTMIDPLAIVVLVWVLHAEWQHHFR
jgi:hypothetical protein